MEQKHTFSAEDMLFDANLQEFAHRIGIICGLESGGQLPPDQAYRQIKNLWKQLKRSRKNLGIGQPPDDSEDLGGDFAE